MSTINLHSLSLALFSKDIQGWGLSPRGAGFLFGADITKAFAHHNAIDLIARAHQLAMEGYKHMFDQTIVTVWSAPNYCYRCGNVASILQLDEFLGQEYKVFNSAPLASRNSIMFLHFGLPLVPGAVITDIQFTLWLGRSIGSSEAATCGLLFVIQT